MNKEAQGLDLAVSSGYATIGHIREDGSVDVLATVNNINLGLSAQEFKLLVDHLGWTFQMACPQFDIGVFARQDSPDVVDLED